MNEGEAKKKEFAELDPDEKAEAKQNTFQKRLLRALERVPGYGVAMIVIPQPVLELCENDLPKATMLSHLIFLCDKGGRKDLFIWKSFREWKTETGLSQYEVTQATAWLKTKGILSHTGGKKTDKKKISNIRIKGHPTRHYKLDQDTLVQAIGKIVANQHKDIAKKADRPEWPEQFRQRFLKKMGCKKAL